MPLQKLVALTKGRQSFSLINQVKHQNQRKRNSEILKEYIRKVSFPLVGNLSFPERLRTSRNDRKEHNVFLLIAPLVRLPLILLLGISTLLYTFIPVISEVNAWDEIPAFAEVARISDGDSIIVKTGRKREKIRLIGIDAPEIRQKPWGQTAKKHLRELIGRSSVKIETDVVKRDRYGRLLAYIWTNDGKFINREMLRDGYAVLYTIPPNVKYVDKLRAAQAEAKEKRIGIWGQNGLKKLPRHYRKEHPR